MLRMQAWRRERAEERLFYRIAAGARTPERVQSRGSCGARHSALAPTHISSFYFGPTHAAQETSPDRRGPLVAETRRDTDDLTGRPRRVRAGDDLQHGKERRPHRAVAIPDRRQQGAPVDRGRQGFRAAVVAG